MGVHDVPWKTDLEKILESHSAVMDVSAPVYAPTVDAQQLADTFEELLAEALLEVVNLRSVIEALKSTNAELRDLILEPPKQGGEYHRRESDDGLCVCPDGSRRATCLVCGAGWK